MPVTIEESDIGRRHGGDAGERQFKIAGADTEAEALDALLTNAPTVVNSKLLDNGKCYVDEVGLGYWVGTAVYSSPELLTTSSTPPSLSFNITGQTVRITQGLSAGVTYPPAAPGEFIKNFNGAIGVSKDKVEGCDIIAPVATITWSEVYDDAEITNAFTNALLGAVGTINDDEWRGKPQATCLLQGVSGSKRTDGSDLWDLTYTVGYSPNQGSDLGGTDIVIGGITVTQKYGWDYLWVYYEQTEQVSDSIAYVQPVPKYITTIQVYRETDFTELLGA